MKEGWEVKSLGDLTEVITKGTTPTSVGFKYEDQGVFVAYGDSQVLPDRRLIIQCKE